MSNIINHIGGGGTDMEGTLLWTNPNPSASFPAQRVSLTERTDRYQYIRIVFMEITTSPTNRLAMALQMLKLSGQKYVGFIGLYTNNQYYRMFDTSGENEIYFNSCVNGSDSVCVPLEIYGID